MKRILFTAVAVAALILAGCSRSPIVGTWEGSDPSMPTGSKASFTFSGDGSYTSTMDIQGTTITMSGTYTLEEKALTMTPVSVDAKGGAFAEIVKEGFEKGGKQPVNATVEFKGDDEMALTAGVGTTTLKKTK